MEVAAVGSTQITLSNTTVPRTQPIVGVLSRIRTKLWSFLRNGMDSGTQTAISRRRSCIIARRCRMIGRRRRSCISRRMIGWRMTPGNMLSCRTLPESRFGTRLVDGNDPALMPPTRSKNGVRLVLAGDPLVGTCIRAVLKERGGTAKNKVKIPSINLCSLAGFGGPCRPRDAGRRGR